MYMACPMLISGEVYKIALVYLHSFFCNRRFRHNMHFIPSSILRTVRESMRRVVDTGGSLMHQCYGARRARAPIFHLSWEQISFQWCTFVSKRVGDAVQQLNEKLTFAVFTCARSSMAVMTTTCQIAHKSSENQSMAIKLCV